MNNELAFVGGPEVPLQNVQSSKSILYTQVSLHEDMSMQNLRKSLLIKNRQTEIVPVSEPVNALWYL